MSKPLPHTAAPGGADSENRSCCVRPAGDSPDRNRLLETVRRPDQGRNVTFFGNKIVDNGFPGHLQKTAEIRHFPKHTARESRKILDFPDPFFPETKKARRRASAGHFEAAGTV